MSSTLLSNSENLISNFSKSLKDSFISLLLSLFIIFCLISGLLILGGLLYYLPIYREIININDIDIFIFRIIWRLVMAVPLFLVGIFAEILLIITLFKPKNSLKDNLKAIKPIFWPFTCLIILSYILFIVASAPIHVGMILIIAENYILGIISAILGFVLITLLVAYIMFSPFIIINKKQSCISAIKNSFKVAEKNILSIVLHLLILVFAYIIFQAFITLMFFVPVIGVFLSSVLMIAMILFTFIYMFAMYKTYSNNNAT